MLRLYKCVVVVLGVVVLGGCGCLNVPLIPCI